MNRSSISLVSQLKNGVSEYRDRMGRDCEGIGRGGSRAGLEEFPRVGVVGVRKGQGADCGSRLGVDIAEEGVLASEHVDLPGQGEGGFGMDSGNQFTLASLMTGSTFQTSNIYTVRQGYYLARYDITLGTES